MIVGWIWARSLGGGRSWRGGFVGLIGGDFWGFWGGVVYWYWYLSIYLFVYFGGGGLGWVIPI